jgi:hypothetical protein
MNGARWIDERCMITESSHDKAIRWDFPKVEMACIKKLEDIRITSWKDFTPEQKNAACSICHAKMSPVTATFAPWDPFFDHFDLATLEDPDFYPYRRDLGENYTYTSWMMSPCAKAGTLHCITCRTSSGCYRFKAEENANDACMPCHEKRVKEAAAHTHHKEGPLSVSWLSALCKPSWSPDSFQICANADGRRKLWLPPRSATGPLRRSEEAVPQSQ